MYRFIVPFDKGGSMAFASTAVELYEKPALLEAAWSKWRETLDGENYCCPIPDDCHPFL
ncbi:MAG: hypothetical protein HFE83_10155 [Lachnospiraceae bacterium]|nr:hypothetical protein [Lachnospiraceae bacterium]